MHKLAQSVLDYIHNRNLLRPGDRVGVAVSGGADSVALLRILLELRDAMGLVLSVVHLNHCLRGPESDGDEQFVRDLAARFDLRFLSSRRDVQAHAAEKKLGIETAARELRYAYFEELLRKGECNKIATAHTLDDQAETVLLKLTRGAGTRGLAGIYPTVVLKDSEGSGSSKPLAAHRGAIVRPLLSTMRADVEQYLREIDQPWRDDSTNSKLQHTRNRIRHEILPLLCRDVNPDARQTLAEAAEIARAEQEYWDAQVQEHLPLIWSAGPEAGTLDCARLLASPLALQRRLVRAAAETLGLSLEFSHVEDLLFLSDDGNSRTALPGGWTARRTKRTLEFRRSTRTAATEYEYRLPVPGEVKLPEAAVVISTSILSGEIAGAHSLLESRFAGALVLRNWRAGDRFWPANTKAPKKIKELLQDRHIIGEEKKCWPVVASGDEVVWVRALGVRRDLLAHDGDGILITEEPLA